MELNEFWENQRHYGLGGWYIPPPFEKPQWTDGTGSEVTFEKSNNEPSNFKNQSQYHIEINGMTDKHGWIYGTKFENLKNKRDGGRASKRATDTIRQRKWIKNTEMEKVADVTSCRSRGSKLPSKGIRAFVSLMNQMMEMKNIWDFIPWDLTSFLVVHAEHHEYLNSFLSLQLRLTNFNEDQNNNKLLDSIKRCIEYSSAAYGYAMEAGHMMSIESFLTMRTIHNSYFDPVAGASIEANVEAVSKIAKIPKEDIILSQWTNSHYRPCHFLALDHNYKNIIICIRGSLEAGDIVTDISGEPLLVSFNNQLGHVHEGLMAAAINVQYNITEILKKTIEDYTGYPILITGHSLGGGVAALLALILKEDEFFKSNDIKCLAIAPPAVMCDKLGNVCSSYVTSVIHRTDVVPRLSAYGVEKLLKELTRASPIKNALDKIVETASSTFKTIQDNFKNMQKNIKKEKLEAVENRGLGKILDFESNDVIEQRAAEAIKKLKTNIKETNNIIPMVKEAEEIKNEITEENMYKCFEALYPPGRVLWIIGGDYKSEENNNKEYELINIKNEENERKDDLSKELVFESSDESDENFEDVMNGKHPVLVEVDRKTFGRILVHPAMITDHFPLKYLDAINHVKFINLNE